MLLEQWNEILYSYLLSAEAYYTSDYSLIQQLIAKFYTREIAKLSESYIR